MRNIRFVCRGMRNVILALIALGMLSGLTGALAAERAFDKAFSENEYDQLIKIDAVSANVIPESENRPHTFTIDKGSADGIKENMVVITETGLVGHIYKVEASSAEVRTIMDHDSLVGCMIERTRSSGILKSEAKAANDDLFLLYLPPEDGASVDDLVITSGIDQIYPRGIRIGHVSENMPDADDDGSRVNLSVDFSNITNVEVLLT